MSLDASLKIKSTMGGNRSVMTRAERFKKLVEDERWSPERGVLGLPKVRVKKAAVKKKEAKAEAAAGTPGAAAAPAAAGKEAGAKKDAAAPAKKDAKK